MVWKKIPSINENFTYSEGHFRRWDYPPIYFQITSAKDAQVSFNFTGSELRLKLAYMWSNSKNIEVCIDGVIVANLSIVNPVSHTNTYDYVAYEKTDLADREHCVTLTNKEEGDMYLDGIEINENEEIKPYNTNVIPTSYYLMMKIYNSLSYDNCPELRGIEFFNKGVKINNDKIDIVYCSGYYGSGYEIEFILDNDYESMWCGDNLHDTDYIILKSDYVFDEIKIYNSGQNVDNYAVRKMDIFIKRDIGGVTKDDEDWILKVNAEYPQLLADYREETPFFYIKYLLQDKENNIFKIHDEEPVLVSEIGTNGLTKDSYSASSHYNDEKYPASACFDGVLNYGGEGDKKQGTMGVWESGTNQTANQWIQIKFNSKYKIVRLRYKNEHDSYTRRIPKDCILQGSNVLNPTDKDFSDIYEFQLENKVGWQEVAIKNKFDYNVYRLYMKNNYGDSSYISIGELELYHSDYKLTNLGQIVPTEEVFKNHGNDIKPALTKSLIEQIGDFKLLTWTDDKKFNNSIRVQGKYKDKIFNMLDNCKILIHSKDTNINKINLTCVHEPKKLLSDNYKLKMWTEDSEVITPILNYETLPFVPIEEFDNPEILINTPESQDLKLVTTGIIKPPAMDLKDPELLILTKDNSKTLMIDGVPDNQHIVSTKDIPLYDVKNIDWLEMKAPNTKAIFSIDKGVNWLTYYNDTFVPVNNTKEDISKYGVLSSDIKTLDLNFIMPNDANDKQIRFSYLLINKPGEEAYIDKISTEVDLEGHYVEAIKGVDYNVSYPTRRVQRVIINNPGTYKVNKLSTE